MSITAMLLKSFLSSKFGDKGAQALLDEARKLEISASHASNPALAPSRDQHLHTTLTAAPQFIDGIHRLGILPLRMPTPQKEGLLLVLNKTVAADPIIAATLARWGKWDVLQIS